MSQREEMEERIRREAQAHDNGCDCKTCRAASGDDSAMEKLLNELL